MKLFEAWLDQRIRNLALEDELREGKLRLGFSQIQITEELRETWRLEQDRIRLVRETLLEVRDLLKETP